MLDGTDGHPRAKPVPAARIKGFVSGLVSISLTYALGMDTAWDLTIVCALLPGSFSYGITIINRDIHITLCAPV